MHHFLKNACLLTDFYQFTMAQASFDHGRHHLDAVFHLFFRKNPFKGNWALAAGIQDALDFVSCFQFDDDSLDFLSKTTNEKGIPFFTNEFISFLKQTRPTIDVYGVADGEVVFPFEPIVRIEGPLYLCQLLETPILNIINFQTLIATKAARMVEAAQGKTIIDFGLRRAQGFDGALSATKAAFIGGIDATSNVWAGKNLGIPLGGTQAHSFIMSYEKQMDAFRDFAHSFKDNCVLVVDTHDPIAGINDAIKVFLKLKNQGGRPGGIRLDSGDLIHLSMTARSALNRAGLAECKIIASGDLDEYEIDRLEKAHAPIDVYGVGTKLITAYDDPALSGVYKMAAIREHGVWRDTLKDSATKEKNSWPGSQSILRSFKDNFLAFDHIVDKNLGKTSHNYIDPADNEVELHRHLMQHGSSINRKHSLLEMRMKAKQSIKSLPTTIRHIAEAQPYPVYFDEALVKKKHSFATQGNVRGTS